MRPGALIPSRGLEEETAPPAEVYRRIGTFLEALAALPKKDWRPRRDGRGIRIEGPGLERVRRLLDALGNPHRGRKIIHVVGTSGKGSAALMIAESLRASGRSAAAFFSPHLSSLAERFWVNGRFLDAPLAGRCARRLAAAAAEVGEDPAVGPPSYFEGTLGLLLLAAEAAGCDCLILEAGLGGSYDATRAAAPAVLDVITPIGLDHTDLLGESVTEVARDKAGIITPAGRVLCGADHPDARMEVERAARERGAELHDPPRAEGLRWGIGGCRFDLRFGDGTRWGGIETRMGGAHQAANAALAAGACRLLGLGEDSVRAGVSAARLPARLERMAGWPAVILDGAHNRDKARALAEAVVSLSARRRIFVVGALEDKDYGGMAAAFAPAGDRFFATLPPGGTPRPALPPEKLAAALEGAGAVGVRVLYDPWAALDAALAEAGEEDLVIVAGSFYLAGELRRRWVPAERIAASGEAFPEGGAFPEEPPL